MAPPVLSRDRARGWHKELVAAAREADRIANRVTRYAGGGIAAHRLHEADKALKAAARAVLDAAPPDDAEPSSGSVEPAKDGGGRDA